MSSVSDGERHPEQSITSSKPNCCNELHGKKQSSIDEIQSIALEAGVA
jgi:hypothetical protein